MIGKELRHAAKAGEPPLERETKPLGRRFRLLGQFLIVELREIDQPSIVPEIIIAQLRKAIEAETFDHQPVEMAGQEIGEKESPGLFLHHGREIRSAREEFITMRAGDPLDPLAFEDAVEFAAGAAIAIEAENIVVLFAILGDLALHFARYAFGAIVQFGGKTSHVDMAERAALKVHNLTRQRAAGDDQDAPCAPWLCILAGDDLVHLSSQCLARFMSFPRKRESKEPPRLRTCSVWIPAFAEMRCDASVTFFPVHLTGLNASDIAFCFSDNLLGKHRQAGAPALTPSALGRTLADAPSAFWRFRPPRPRRGNRRQRRRPRRKIRSRAHHRPERYSRCECPSPSSYR